MPVRLGPWALALLLTVLCAGAVGGVWYFRSAAQPTASSMQHHLPPNVSMAMGVNVAALRASGVLDTLTGSTSVEEPDYRNFVSLTGFDYRTDLDYVLAGFRGENRFFLASGRFDWGSIMKYASLNDGTCTFGFCRMGSSTPDRRISYFAQRSNVLALGIGADEWGANALEQEYSWPSVERAPTAPVWLLLRQPVFDGTAPEALRPWLRLLIGARQAFFTLVRQSDGGFELHMTLSCTEADHAVHAQHRLASATEELKSALQKDDKPIDGKTLPAILGSGKFIAKGTSVEGSWEVDRDFIAVLAGGDL